MKLITCRRVCRPGLKVILFKNFFFHMLVCLHINFKNVLKIFIIHRNQRNIIRTESIDIYLKKLSPVVAELLIKDPCWYHFFFFSFVRFTTCACSTNTIHPSMLKITYFRKTSWTCVMD